MVREDISSGIKVALERGESIESAMMTFYNAGYKKEEIEEAAKFVYMETKGLLKVEVEKKQADKQLLTQEKKIEPILPKQLIPINKNLQIEQKPVQKQEISSYEENKPKKKINKIVIVLAILLLVLFGLLLVIFLFKEKIIEFLDSIMSS